jgi:hypothetical protein
LMGSTHEWDSFWQVRSLSVDGMAGRIINPWVFPESAPQKVYLPYDTFIL